MYNVEKYVGQCLDSLLNQTFQDFEVIVLDDCSTDDSVSVVESYISKFNGRLRLIKLSKNNGGAAQPRNIGIGLSRGEYIAFVDSDDLLTNTALEEFYNIAKDTNADVVQAEKFFITKDKLVDENTKFEIKAEPRDINVQFVNKPTFESDNIIDRIAKYAQGKVEIAFGYPWNKFCRRDFLMENNIRFPTTLTREDIMFCFQCLCLAKKYVRIPNIVNIYRLREESQSHSNKIVLDKHMNKWGKDIIEGVKFMDQFMNSIDVLAKNPELRYAAIDHFMQEELDWYMMGIYNQVPPYAIDDILRNLFSIKSEENSALMSYVFSSMNIYRLNLIRAQRQIAQLQQQNKELLQKLQTQK